LYKDAFPPVVGGIERMMWWLARRQVAAGNNVTLLVSQPNPKVYPTVLPSEETVEGVNIVRLKSFLRPGGTPICPGMTARLRQLAPSIIHLHHPNPSSDVAYLLAGMSEPMVVTWHSDVVRQKIRYRAYAPVQQKMLRKARAIMPTSQRYLETSEQLKNHRDRCTVVPLGVERSGAEVPVAEICRLAAERRREWSATGDLPVVLFVGVLRYYKGLDFLLDAAAKLPGLRFVLAGDGPERQDLERRVRNLHIGDRVHFLGYVPDEELPVLHAASDMFCLPSHLRAEAFGLSMVEAMQAGLPVVACDLATGVPEVNEDGKTGIIVPAENADMLAVALRRLGEDEALRRRLGENGRIKANREYTADRMASRVADVYESVLGMTPSAD